MAGRYATALFELALEEHALDAVRADLDRFGATLEESADLQRLVRSPVFTADEQLKALSAILDKAGITGLVAANSLRAGRQANRWRMPTVRLCSRRTSLKMTARCATRCSTTLRSSRVKCMRRAWCAATVMSLMAGS